MDRPAPRPNRLAHRLPLGHRLRLAAPPLAAAILLLRPSSAVAGPVTFAPASAGGGLAQITQALLRAPAFPIPIFSVPAFSAPAPSVSAPRAAVLAAPAMQVDFSGRAFDPRSVPTVTIQAAYPAVISPAAGGKATSISEPGAMSLLLTGMAGLIIARAFGRRPTGAVAG